VTRFVIDTNVFVSDLIGRKGSATDQLVRAFVEDKLEVVASPALLDELERVLARPKVRRHVNEAQAREYIERIRRQAVIADDPQSVQADTRDPGDDYFVALARRKASTRSSAAIWTCARPASTILRSGRLVRRATDSRASGVSS
jgi:putative PIN family toxin of toxin-antitoxin system